MFRSIAIWLLLTTTAAADIVSDAYGILPETALSRDRAAWAGLRDGTGSNIVRPQVPESVLIFIGPKALVAGKDDGHAVALVFDRFGNLAQNHDVVFTLQSNGEAVAKLRDGLADVLFMPAPIAGTFAGGATVGQLQSPRATFRVTADLQSVVPSIQGTQRVSAETFANFSTNELKDQFGNVVEDGVGATIILSHAGAESTFLFAPVREATAKSSLLGRDIRAGGLVTAHIGTASGSGRFQYVPQRVAFAPKVRVWAKDALGAIGIRLGPFTTEAGHLLNDGSPIRVRVAASDGPSVTAHGWIQDGYFETTLLRPADDKTLNVSFETAIISDTRNVVIQDTAPGTILGVE